METISSSSEPIPPESNLLMPEDKEISSSEVKATGKKRRLEEDESPTEQGSRQGISVGSLNSEAAPPLSKATNKKRRLEEDTIPTEQVPGKSMAGTFVESSVLAEIPPEDQGRKSTLLHRKNEPSGLDSSDEVKDRVDDDTGDSSIRDAASATSTTVPPILPPDPTPTSHGISVQTSASAADLHVERDTAPKLASPTLAETPIEESDTDTRPSKKARLDIEPAVNSPVPTSAIPLGTTDPLAVVISDANITPQTNVLPKPSPIVVLPVELLSEILIYTRSPQHVLAVARTCKALCQTLLSTHNQFIWRMARRAGAFDLEAGPVYLPDPPHDFFGEAAYAAFVFDAGACDVSIISLVSVL
jgi:hypothetical protein